jgi:hypothetical protein
MGRAQEEREQQSKLRTLAEAPAFFWDKEHPNGPLSSGIHKLDPKTVGFMISGLLFLDLGHLFQKPHSLATLQRADFRTSN